MYEWRVAELEAERDALAARVSEAVDLWEEMKLPVDPGTGRPATAVPFMRLDQIMGEFASPDPDRSTG